MKKIIGLVCFLSSLSCFAQQEIVCSIYDGKFKITLNEKNVAALEESSLVDPSNGIKEGPLTSIEYKKTNVVLTRRVAMDSLSSLTFDKRNLGEDIEFDATYVYRNSTTYSADIPVTCVSHVQ